MIIWINGAFGAGKTQAAYELQRRHKDAYVYDPENLGFFIRSNIPPSISAEDFQDYPMWRTCNFDMLDYISARFSGDIIVPMTITNRTYYEEITGRLAKKYAVKHFILWAEKDTLLRRLASRGENRHSWGARQIDRCIEAFERDITECRISTDSMTIDQVVERIAELSGITLPKDTRSNARKLLDRIITQFRHIR